MIKKILCHISYSCSALSTTYYNGTAQRFSMIGRDNSSFSREFLATLVYKDKYDISEFFLNYNAKSLHEMVKFIADNQETYSWVNFFRERTDTSTNVIYLHLADDINSGSGRIPNLPSVGLVDYYGKYAVSTARLVKADANNLPGDVHIGEVGNKIMTLELNEEFIKYIDSLNRLDGNVMILDILMNILDSEQVVGVSWTVDDYLYYDTAFTTFGLASDNTKNPAVIGDCNGDGAVNGIDAYLMRRLISGNGDKVDPFAVDLNSDGKITAIDSLLLKKMIVGA